MMLFRSKQLYIMEMSKASALTILTIFCLNGLVKGGQCFSSKKSSIDQNPSETQQEPAQNRIGSQILTLPITAVNSVQQSLLSESGSKPKLALFFNNRRQTPRTYDSKSRELLAHYLPLFPKRTYLVDIIGESIEIDGENVDAFHNEALTVLFYEKPNQIEVKTFVSDVGSKFPDTLPLADIIPSRFDDALYNSPAIHWYNNQLSNSPFALIIFTPKVVDQFYKRFERFRNNNKFLVKCFTERYIKNPGGFALWGSEILAEELNSPGRFNPYVLSRISGSAVQAWSLVVDQRLPVDEIRKKIEKFTKTVDLSSGERIALSLRSASNNQQSSEIDQTFKGLIPEMKLMTFRIKSDLEKYCLDSWLYTESQPPEFNSQVLFDSNYDCFLFIKFRN